MPKSQVEVRRSYAAHEEVAIMDAVHESLIAAFGIPASDRGVRYVEHRPERFSTPPGLADPDRHILVTIDCLPGRMLDKKRRLYTELGERLAPVGIPADHITVIIHEVPADDWGLGGTAATDADLAVRPDL